MVKITNQFGDVKKGKQHTVVYQNIYGNQMRRTLKEKKDEHTRGQLEQRARFKVGIDFAKGLTKAQRDFIKTYMAEKNIRSPDGLPTTWYSFTKKIAMTIPKVEMETESCEGFAAPYTNWNYRRPITVNNTSGGELTNYQVLITLTTENFTYAKCKNDGSDIRFSRDDKTTPLSYWIEDWNYNGTSKLWIKVANIPTGQNLCAYLYYDNSEATDESNGAETFKDYNLQDILSGGTPTASDYLAGYPASKACDNDTDPASRWIRLGSTSWWKYDLGEGTTKTVRALRYLAIDTQEIKAFTLRGSNDDSNWDILLTDQGINVSDNITWQEWIFQNPTAYRYYKVQTTSVWSTNHGAIEFEMIGTDIITASYHMQKMGSYFNTRKYATPEPTNELGTEEASPGGITLKGFTIHHPALKSYEIFDTGIKVEGLSNLEDHISTVITKTNLNLLPTKIIVKTLANQEYQFIVK